MSALYLLALLSAIVAILVVSSGPAAAMVPGTPVPVEPGVPGNNRGWELTTTPDPVTPSILMAGAVATDALFYLTVAPLPGAAPEQALIFFNAARRTSKGWSTSPADRPTLFPESSGDLDELSAFSPDLSEVIWASPVSDETGVFGIYREASDGQLSLLAKGLNARSSFRGTSADFQHVLFLSTNHLLPADATRTEGSSGLYESVGSTLRLVELGNDGLPLSECGSTAPKQNAISADGRRIFFVTRPSCSGPARAYLREDGLTTTEMSASACTLADCGPEADVEVVGATASGTNAFLVTEQRLTDDDADENADLYRYEVSTGELSLLSAVPDLNLAVTTDPVLTTDGGAVVLFWARNPDLGDAKGLYISTPDGPAQISPAAEGFAQLSATGRYALFATKEQLVGGDTDESRDVYRYDVATETLTQISTGPLGGDAAVDAGISPFGDFYPVSTHPYRAMSDDGADVFFTTAEALLAADHNDVVDVYEWREGGLSLVSPGSGDRPSHLLGVTPDGSSAYLRTALTLLPLDRDGGDVDIYAARVGGGFPEPAPPVSCEGDSCLRPLSERLGRVEPRTSLPASASLRIRRPSPRERRRMAATGQIVLLVETGRRDRLAARARARIGGRGQVIASARGIGVGPPEPTQLRMPMSGAARQALAEGDALHVDVALRLSGQRARRVGFVLGGNR